MLIDELRTNWKGMPTGKAMEIPSLSEQGYLSWTIKTKDFYGVALPISSEEDISEFFSGAHYYTETIRLDNDSERKALMLTTEKDDVAEQFAALCAELLNPGENGELRKEIELSPASWWISWKELLGNKNVDMMVYDALGELWTLRYLCSKGEHAEWNGPTGSTYDIDCDEFYTEVKSTTARNKRQITLSNLFQLDPPDGHNLYLVFCQFEPAVSGYSINGLVDDLVELGYGRALLNEKLARIGLEIGKTARNRCYMLHAATQYTVDESFPAIRESSFIGGTKPEGVVSITYVVSLDGLKGINLTTDGEKIDNV